jgi:hypothetical protein
MLPLVRSFNLPAMPRFCGEQGRVTPSRRTLRRGPLDLIKSLGLICWAHCAPPWLQAGARLLYSLGYRGLDSRSLISAVNGIS